MTKNEKDLLTKDLCARMPYGVKVKFRVNEVIAIEENITYVIDGEYSYITDGKSYLTLDIIKALFKNWLDEIKPYLFPLSSMTDEQIYQSPFGYATMDTIRQGDIWSTITIGCKEYADIVDWLNKNHFDYRGLITMGLALDATGLNIY